MQIFFDTIRPMIGGRLLQHQVAGIEAIIAACRAERLTDAETAYVLATAYHETAHTMQPVRESLADSDYEAQRRVYRWVHDNQNKTGPANYAYRHSDTGQAYYGRGYVQLTWRANYQRQAAKLSLPLVEQPDLAMQPTVAALILVRGMRDGDFTGKRLADYFGPDRRDFTEARRIVNGIDRAQTIAQYAEGFLAALQADAATAPQPALQPIPEPPAPTGPTGLLGVVVALLRALATLFKGRKA